MKCLWSHATRSKQYCNHCYSFQAKCFFYNKILHTKQQILSRIGYPQCRSRPPPRRFQWSPDRQLIIQCWHIKRVEKRPKYYNSWPKILLGKKKRSKNQLTGQSYYCMKFRRPCIEDGIRRASFNQRRIFSLHTFESMIHNLSGRQPNQQIVQLILGRNDENKSNCSAIFLKCLFFDLLFF